MKPEDFWPYCLCRLENELTPPKFKMLIQPLSAETQSDGSVVLFASSNFVLKSITEEKLLARIEQWASEQLDGSRVELRLRPLRPEQPAVKSANLLGSLNTPAKPIKAPRMGGTKHQKTRLNDAMTFDTLVVGKGNQFAHAAALQITENPGDPAYNPFFVYGGVGLGKTHLIQAIGNDIHQKNPQANIRLVRAEDYTKDVVNAYRNNAFDAFKRYYHSLDLLLIDDIQFLAKKQRTMEEFFHAFNILLDSGKQVIMTCDTFPKNIEHMDERLVSRFSWGLTVQIQPPELEMRVAILLKKFEMESIKVDDAIAFFIAQHIQGNVRELEGAIKRVIAHYHFNNQPAITVDFVKESLRDILAAGNRHITIDMIQKTVADFYKISLMDMNSKKRIRTITRPRQVAMKLAKELTQLSLPAIGSCFGGKDHTTVLHACRTIAEQCEHDKMLAHDVDVLLSMLRNGIRNWHFYSIRRSINLC